jgi:hypothetical protein
LKLDGSNGDLRTLDVMDTHSQVGGGGVTTVRWLVLGPNFRFQFVMEQLVKLLSTPYWPIVC